MNALPEEAHEAITEECVDPHQIKSAEGQELKVSHILK